MTIKRYVFLYGLALATISVVFVVSLLSYVQNSRLEQALRTEYAYLYYLVEELEDNYVKEMVRIIREFAITGDESLAESYNYLLMVWQGQIPRPVGSLAAPTLTVPIR